ncbi:ATPase [Seongchinamella sediminis]|uniref:ATPase n=1 Tax=Seongchinamella sediminis TaxID=2283635 RepID=A0A3L7E315_9GAMM|nr:permease [Seongchinamella sediminis]RLQ22761.1 ATPase [Seongchinamella sediminis]
MTAIDQQQGDQRREGSCCASQQAAETSASCHPAQSDDSCCETPANRDYFLWTCLVIVAVAYPLGALAPHDHDTAFGVFTGGIFELFNAMWWGMALGIVFVGLLSRVPRELVMGVLGRDGGLHGLLRATLAGVFLDLCSHGILAVGMKLYERGATIGQVMAFLLASPWNSFSLTLILFGLIGVGWTLLFIVLSLVIGIISGLIFDALVARGTLPQNPSREELGEERPLGEMWAELRQSMTLSASGTAGILRDGFAGSRVVIRWSLFGLILAGAIRALMPEESFATWFGATMGGLWLTLLATTIIEVCSEGSTPIAADLLNRAGAPGNAFTFLMAGVATDYTEVMSIRDTSRSWKIALYLPLITVPQVMVLGYILNHF